MENNKVDKFSAEGALARAAAITTAGPDGGIPPIETPPPVDPNKEVVDDKGGAGEKVEPVAKPTEEKTTEIKPEDIFGVLKEKYQIGSEAELSEMLLKANRLTEVESNTQKLSLELEELRTKANTSPFADPYIEKLNALYASNAPKDQIKAFTKLYELGDIKEMSDEDVRLMALQLREGYNSKEASLYMKKHYPMDEDDFSEDEIALAKADLRRDSAKDREFLSTQLEELSKAPVEKQEIEASNRIKEYAGKLDKVLPTLVQTIQSVDSIELSTKKGEEFSFDFPIPPEHLAHAEVLAKNYAVQNKIPLTEEGMNDIREYLKTTFIAANAKQYLQTAYEQGRANKESEMLAKYHIPGYISGTTKSATPQPSSEFEAWKKANAERTRR